VSEFQGEVTLVQDVVTEADYLATVGRALLAAPPHSVEERGLGEVYEHACQRLDVDGDELLERMSAVAPVIRAAEVFDG
jgi:hypothetical protein